ncbi:MAG: hypothetical protein LKE92_08695 [Atopobiaceae bacterium]|nr:hypothetical protein [Atopobium sp.]MCH4082175.1 hypothetical protein [Atopobiaceae bacterium]MCI1344780.1 hypothetical protein [Atopobiaceae bacterium]MCI1497903.1 hypothetical protein [Atopobiaceae bacterium]MCI1539686.1 hypothetical protein [Atopobiaceae bacterium]
MRKRTIDTEAAAMEVSAVAFGCMGMSHTYGAPVPEEEGIKGLREAVEIAAPSSIPQRSAGSRTTLS